MLPWRWSNFLFSGMSGFDLVSGFGFPFFYPGFCKDTQFLSQVTPYPSVCGELWTDEEAVGLARLRFGSSAPDSGER